MVPRRGEYGVDAPYAPVFIALCSTPLVVGAASNALAGHLAGAMLMGLGAAVILAGAATYLHTTRVGKFKVWDEIIESLALKGDEQVLDMGCGRGAVLLLAAQRLPRGKATGVDLWSTADQSGNGADSTRENARLEGVADRIELQTGDMQKLPFPDARFDVVLSSLAIHNISGAQGRAQAISEAARVLKPGGRLAIADIRHTKAYQAGLGRAGLGALARRGLGPRFWYGFPWVRTVLVTGVKPAER